MNVPLRQSSGRVRAAKPEKAAARQPVADEDDLPEESGQDDEDGSFAKQAAPDPPSVLEDSRTSSMEPEEAGTPTAVNEEQETEGMGQQEAQPDETGQEEPDNDDMDDDIGILAQLFGGLKFQ